VSSYAWLTPPAPAALALARLRSPPARLFDRPLPSAGRARFARLRDATDAVVDEAVIWRLADGVVELSIHGGPGMRAAVDACLRSHGLNEEPLAPDPTWNALAHAASPAAARWLLRHGPTAAPPFPRDFLARAPLVLITGVANAGKSTLLNAWCGRERALVSDVPGTTRDLLAAEALVHGWRLRLLDSAGLRASADDLERAGQELVAHARARADLVIYLRAPGDETPSVAGDLEVLGKADLRTGPANAIAWSNVVDRAGHLRALEAAVLARLGLHASGC
jgi:tRNA U34 5-carboxymethylaminomethyl modifying GTPase MnmE/TrmE